MDKINVLDGINFRFVLMYMLRKIHKEHNKQTTSFNIIIMGTAKSKTTNAKKSKQEESKHECETHAAPPTCTMCGMFYHERTVCSQSEGKYANKTNGPTLGPLPMRCQCSLIPNYMYMYITDIYIYMLYMAYRTLDSRYTLPYIPIHVLYHTKRCKPNQQIVHTKNYSFQQIKI